MEDNLVDKEELVKIQALIELFNKRERLYDHISNEIADMIGPSLLEGLITFFGAKYENVVWLDLRLTDLTIEIAASVGHGCDETVPELIEKLAPTEPIPDGEDVVLIQRIMKIMIPLGYAFKPKDVIVKFLTEQIGEQSSPTEYIPTVLIKEPSTYQEGEVEETEHATSQFDPSGLSKDQIHQMLIFQHQSKNTMH